MKKTKILAGLLIAFTLNSCSLLPDTLPDETQSGKNTFGCKINGKIFTPADQGLNKGSIGKNYDGSLLIVGENGDGRIIGFNITKISSVGVYTQKDTVSLFYEQIGQCSYGGKKSVISAKIGITKFERGEDKPNNLRWLIVSGRFEGVIISDIKTCKDTIHITEGRFDVKFQ